MRITDVKSYPVRFGHRNLMLVKVETDEGLFGWGESGLSSRELAVAGAIDHFREFLIGKDARQIGRLWQEMYRGQYFEGGRVLTAAISAVDIALWDIAGKAAGLPISALLGGRQRDSAECFVTSIHPHTGGLVEEVSGLARDGWKVIRLAAGNLGTTEASTEWCPRRELANTAALIAEIRQEIGRETVLGIDYHHRLSVAETASFVQRLPAGALDFLEEPIRHQTPDAYKALRQMCDVPFAIGEECASKWDFRPYIEQDITNFARIDVCNVGGVTEAMKIAAMAETHYIDVMPHDPLGPVCTATTLQVVGAIPNFCWYELPPYGGNQPVKANDLFEGVPVLDGHAYPIADRPGHGVTVNEAYAKSLAFEFWEAPRMHKPDGSFTNW